jgi:acyl-coenzyme A synthetase/AMP-(fatty) acid ligase
MNIPEHFNFVEHVLSMTPARADHPALFDSTHALTYSQLDQRIRSLAQGLKNHGLRREERVAIILKDSCDTAAVILAVMYAGMVAVPLDPRSSPSNLKYCVEHSGASLVIAETDLCLLFANQVTIVSRDEIPAWFACSALAPVRTHRDSACIFMYTSGTTGHPKAVVHCHGALITIGTLYGTDAIGVRSADRLFSAPKLFFSFGLLSLWTVLTAGASLVLNPGIFIPSTVAELIVKFKVTITTAVPVLYGKLLEQSLTGHQLRLSLSGGDRLPESICHRWLQKNNVHLRNIYGSTEAGTAFMYNYEDTVPGSIGRPIAGYELLIRDEQLWVRAPSAGLCYWHDTHWSKQQFGEWMPTGDIVSKDAQGNYYFLGRASDVVKVNGKYVDLGKIEQAVMSVCGVQEAVVVGKMSMDGHTRLKAYVVAVPGHAIVDVDIQKHVNELAIIDQMPRTENGKIQRYKLRSQM